MHFTAFFYIINHWLIFHFFSNFLQISLCKTRYCTISTMCATYVRFELGTPDVMAAMLWFTWPLWVMWPRPWTNRDWLPKVTHLPRLTLYWPATRLWKTSKFEFFFCFCFGEMGEILWKWYLGKIQILLQNWYLDTS